MSSRDFGQFRLFESSPSLPHYFIHVYSREGIFLSDGRGYYHAAIAIFLTIDVATVIYCEEAQSETQATPAFCHY
jgi:hypothetical protein